MNHVAPDQRENYQGAVHEPVRKYMKMFPAINEKVKHHERCALEYAKVRRAPGLRLACPTGPEWSHLAPLLQAQDRYDKVLKSGSGDQSKRDKVRSNLPPPHRLEQAGAVGMWTCRGSRGRSASSTSCCLPIGHAPVRPSPHHVGAGQRRASRGEAEQARAP